MFFSEDPISEAEKINRIYAMLRAQRRARLFGLFIRLSLFSGIIYGYYYLSLPANAELRTEITSTIQTKMSELIMPMVGSMVQDLTQSMTQSTQGSKTNNKNTPSQPPINITPELLKAAQDALQKKQ